MLRGKKILLKGLKSRAGKPYDAYIIPSGTEEYHYTKDGEEKKAGFSLNLSWNFRKRNLSAGSRNRGRKKICYNRR